MTDDTHPDSMTPALALLQLQEGNQRFRESREGGARSWTPSLADQAQRPMAIVLGCSDSRVPVELVFDQGFGQLFVVRLAGNVVAPSVVGSIEFAASQFGTPLVVVLGHTGCGAIAATLESLSTGAGPESKNIRALTERIAPHIATIVERGEREGRPDREVMRDAIRANVRAAADHLRHGSRLLEDLVCAGRVAVVCAEYDLESGAVDFFEDDHPPR